MGFPVARIGGAMTDDAGTNTDDESALADTVRAARAGDGAAFLRLADRYRPQIVRFLAAQLADPSRVDLDDLAQQAFDAAYDGLPRLREPTRFRTWLFAIARRRMLDALDRQKREVPLDTLAVPPTMPAPDLPLTLTDLVETAAGPLSDEVRTMLDLRVQGYSIAVIAARMGKTPAAVERALIRVRRALRILWQKD